MSLWVRSIENNRAEDSPEYHTHLQGAISEQSMRWILTMVFMIYQIKVAEDAIEYHLPARSAGAYQYGSCGWSQD